MLITNELKITVTRWSRNLCKYPYLLKPRALMCAVVETLMVCLIFTSLPPTGFPTLRP